MIDNVQAKIERTRKKQRDSRIKIQKMMLELQVFKVKSRNVIKAIKTSDGKIFEELKEAKDYESKLLLMNWYDKLPENNYLHPNISSEDVAEFLSKNRENLLMILNSETTKL